MAFATDLLCLTLSDPHIPGTCFAINKNREAVEPVTATITAVGDLDGTDRLRGAKIHLPPGIRISSCVRAAPSTPT